MVKSCSIPGCVSGLPKDRKIRKNLNMKQASLFSVPKDAVLLSQWSSILKMNLCDKTYICDYHFKESDIIKTVRHDFPDGNYQIIPKERWTLLPNAIPVNPEPKGHDTKITQNQTNWVHQSSQQLDNEPCAIKIVSLSSHEENSAQFPSKRRKSNNKIININQQSLSQSAKSIGIISIPQSAYSHLNMRKSHKGETITIDTVQVPLNPMNHDKNLNSFQDIERFVNIPPAWYYIRNLKEMIFVHVDSFKFMEKLRVFINADMSVMVSVNQRKKIDWNLKITCKAELLRMFEELKKVSVCTGTGMKDISASARCCGIILNCEKYKRQQRNPKCIACRILRHRLLTKAAKQRHAANKKYYQQQQQLSSYKNKCKQLQKRLSDIKFTIKSLK